MKSLRKLLSLLLCLVTILSLLASCGASGDYRDYSYFAMDTYATVRLSRKSAEGKTISKKRADEIAEECAAIIQKHEKIFSVYDSDSEVCALNSQIHKMLSPDAALLSVIETSNTVNRLTDGAFDHTLGALSALWNAKDGGPVPTSEEIAGALTHTGKNKFAVSDTSITKLDEEAKLDFGGIAKGYVTQKVLEYLSTTEVASGIVSLGGSVGVHGEKADYNHYKIGLRDPQNGEEILGYLYLTSGFVSVSGETERYFEADGKRYHHILDPRTGYPADNGLISVTVHTSNGSSADALSTALFVLGLERSMELYEEGTLDFEAVFVSEDGTVTVTPGLGDRFDLTSGDYTLPEA